tara:strand:- start:1204 stop:1551 length:348 start_codon:yes stop_codon:yes gene_type:complete
MEEIQQKALRLADRLKVHNNQTRILKEKFVDSNIHFLKGHQFTVDLTLINYCKGLIDLNKIKDVIILDDYKIPVKIDNVQDFFDDLSDLYQRNLNSYWVEYNKLEKSKGEILKDD